MNQDERDFWAQVESLIIPIAKVEIEYRLHYNESGEIIMCSMADHPESNHYVVVSKDKYERYFDYCVVEGQLTKIDKSISYSVKLTKSTAGYRTVKNHAGIVLEPGESYPETEYYDHRNH
jgi:hypothetical protein